MSARSGIVKAMAENIASEFKGSGGYINNVYGNVTNRVMHFDDINDFPYISVTPGREIRDDMPSNISWGTLTVYIRMYVENADDAQGELESLVTDVENFLDLNLQMEYKDTTPSGVEVRSTITNRILAIDTDEGLLDPNALGEVVLEVQYEKIRAT